MHPFLLLLTALITFAPWVHGDGPAEPSSPARMPVTLVVDASNLPDIEGFDSAAAARQLVDGAAARLQARRMLVRQDAGGSYTISTALAAASQTAARTPTPSPTSLPTPLKKQDSLTVSVGFGKADNRWARGTETRFTEGTEDGWRLASRVQRGMTGGLLDVLGYDSYDRGVIAQQSGTGTNISRPVAAENWVTVHPLFATNPEERAMLEYPEVLDLLSAALADAIYDYLDPRVATLPENELFGWRTDGSAWNAVAPASIYKGSEAEKMALTFDGGASSVPTPAILKALRDEGVHATIFLTADFAERNPELVIQMAKDGHEFGNHSSTHPDMTKISSEAMVAELDRLENTVYSLTGKSTRPWFRPPYGACDERVERVAAEQGYRTIMWTQDSADWREDVAASTVRNRILQAAGPGAIMIEHLGSPQSAQVLPDVLREIKGRGIGLGTLSEVLGELD